MPKLGSLLLFFCLIAVDITIETNFIARSALVAAIHFNELVGATAPRAYDAVAAVTIPPIGVAATVGQFAACAPHAPALATEQLTGRLVAHRVPAGRSPYGLLGLGMHH